MAKTCAGQVLEVPGQQVGDFASNGVCIPAIPDNRSGRKRTWFRLKADKPEGRRCRWVVFGCQAAQAERLSHLTGYDLLAPLAGRVGLRL